MTDEPKPEDQRNSNDDRRSKVDVLLDEHFPVTPSSLTDSELGDHVAGFAVTRDKLRAFMAGFVDASGFGGK